MNLSLASSPKGTDLLVIADLSNRLQAAGGQVLLQLPAQATGRFTQDGRRLRFTELAIADRRDYSCTPGSACQAAADQIRARASSLYNLAIGAAQKNGHDVSLIPPGRRWTITLSYGTQTWAEHFEVLNNVLQLRGSHLAIALLGADQ
jgi:hypothetical protein